LVEAEIELSQFTACLFRELDAPSRRERADSFQNAGQRAVSPYGDSNRLKLPAASTSGADSEGATYG
jgi:hypothetical protein